MAAGPVWSQEALDDIDAIAGYIGRDRATTLGAWSKQRLIWVATWLIVRKLAVVPEVNNPKRGRFLYSYRLIYKTSDTGISLLAVIHGKRLPESIKDHFE